MRPPCGARCRARLYPPRYCGSADAEQSQDHQDDDNDEECVYPAAAVPATRRDGWSARVHASTAEVPEEPEQQQDHDEQLDETHGHLRTTGSDVSGLFSAWVSTANAVR